MKYSEQEMAKLISEVETEFKDYLTKSEPTNEVESLEANTEEVVTEEVIAKSEDAFDYDEDDISEMNKMYASMSKSEKDAHYKSLKNIMFSEEDSKEMKKSEETAVAEETNENEELLKSEVEAVKINLETSKKENEELKKNLETLTSIISKVVKSAPKRKAVTQIGDIQYIKKSEEANEETEVAKVDYSKMEKKEINKVLSSKIRSGEIKKSEDRTNINKFCHGELKFDDIKYLL